MNQALKIVDNFHPDPLALRAAVLKSEFKTEVGPDGALYSGISQYKDVRLFELLAEAVDARIVPSLSCFRVSYEGELPHNFAHADTCCNAEYAAVYYLNTPEQCYGGTAFWTHVELGIDHMPSDLEIAAAGVKPSEFQKQMEADWCDETKWAQTGMAGMKFNRVIVYPTTYFHGRYPHKAFGTTLEDGRLIWVCFFSLEK